MLGTIVIMMIVIMTIGRIMSIVIIKIRMEIMAMIWLIVNLQAMVNAAGIAGVSEDFNGQGRKMDEASARYNYYYYITITRCYKY